MRQSSPLSLLTHRPETVTWREIRWVRRGERREEREREGPDPAVSSERGSHTWHRA